MKKVSQIILFIFFCGPVAAKTFVVSDIDDTIKQSNSVSSLGQVYHFYRMKSYPVMATIFQDIAAKADVTFYYVSAAYDFLYLQERWLDRYGFPYGETFLRQGLGEQSYEHKYEAMALLLEQVSDEDDVYFFGDNSSHDPQVYLDIIKDLTIKNSHIFIRDVTMTAHDTGVGLAIERLAGIHYFVSELDLIKVLPLVISAKTKDLLLDLFTDEKLIPNYTHRTLSRLLSQSDRCYHNFIYVKENLSHPCPAAISYFRSYYGQII